MYRRSCLERGWCSWSSGRGCSEHGGAEGEGLAPALEQRELLWAPCLAHRGLGRALAPLSLLRCSHLLSAENQGSWVILKSTVTLRPFMADQPWYHERYHPQSPSKPIPNLFPNHSFPNTNPTDHSFAGNCSKTVISSWEVLEEAWRSPSDSQLKSRGAGDSSWVAVSGSGL